jgi:hypothetical protein
MNEGKRLIIEFVATETDDGNGIRLQEQHRTDNIDYIFLSNTMVAIKRRIDNLFDDEVTVSPDKKYEKLIKENDSEVWKSNIED